MFNVIDKETNLTTLVYSVKEDKQGFAKFLVYEKNQWKWKSAKYFIPLDTDLSINDLYKK